MIQPVLMDETFLTDVALAAKEKNSLHLWWLGQSGFLVLWQAAHLLIDPYLSDSLTKKYANTNRPHVRMTARVVAPEKLDFIDIVTSSHNHTDHLDNETLHPLLQANPDLTILVSEANRQFAAERLALSPERLTGITGQAPLTLGPFTFHAIPSAHECLEYDNQGNSKYIGLVIQAGRWTLYHSGDAVPYPGLAERLRVWSLDVAVLPINGRDPQRGVAGNFTAQEAAELGKAIGARFVLPCHYEMFEFNTVSPQAFIDAAKQIGQSYHLMKCGERWSLPPKGS